MASIDWSVTNETVKKACKNLKSNNLSKVKDALDVLNKIDEETTMDSDRNHFADKLAELKFAQLSKNVFLTIISQNISQKDFDEIAGIIIDIFIHITNYSSAICVSVTEQGLPEILVSEAKRNFAAISRDNSLQQNLRISKTESCLIVLHNVMRLNPDCKQSMRDLGIQELLAKVIKLASGYLQIVGAITLSIVVDSNCNPDLIKVPKPVIVTLLKETLATALSDRIAHSQLDQLVPGVGSERSGCYADETLYSLSILARNRDNAVEMIKQGVLSQIETFLEFAVEQPFIETDPNLHSVNNATKWALNLMLNLVKTVPQIGVLLKIEEILFILKGHPNEDTKQFTCDLITELGKSEMK